MNVVRAKDKLTTQVVRQSLRLVTLAWMFGAVWATATSGAPLTLFAKGLGARPGDFGRLAAIPYCASLLSIVGSILVERFGRRRLIFLAGLYTQRLAWFPLVLLPLWMRHHSVSHALLVFFVFIFIMTAGLAIGVVPWTSWMADLTPARVRGRYFSRRRQWGLLSTIPTAFFVGWLIDGHIDQHDVTQVMHICAMLFICVSPFGLVDIAMFHFVPDIAKPARETSKVLPALLLPLQNRSFLWASGFVGVMTFAMSFMGQYVNLYLVDRVHATGTQMQSIILVAPALAQLLTLPIWGTAADRMGKKPLLILSGIGMVLPGLGWSLLTPSNAWFGVVVAIVGTGLWTGIDIANANLVYELAGSDGEGSSSYAATNTIVINLSGFLGGVCAGYLADLLQGWHWQPFAGWKTLDYFDLLFGVSALLRLLSVVIFLPHIHEPAARTPVATLRFMTGNVYSNLVAATLSPLRWVRRSDKKEARLFSRR